jgi:23S rRNA (uridine2552-2'-O)-methyltransferase
VHPERKEEHRIPSNSWNKKIKQKVEEEDKEPYDPLNIDDFEPATALTGRGTIVAVDLLKMQPIHGVHTIQADFLAAETERQVHNLLSTKGNLEGKADIILSDMVANASGNYVHDIESSLEICEAVFDFASQHMWSAEQIGRQRGGVLLCVF